MSYSKKPSKKDSIESTSQLMDRIVPNGVQILCKSLPLVSKKASKLIGIEKAEEAKFNFGRGLVVSKGNTCTNDDIAIGDEVYCGRSTIVTPNFPNWKDGDTVYFLVSEGSVSYYTKK